MPSTNVNTIGPMLFEANLGYIRMRADSFEEAVMMERRWKSLNHVKMPDEDFISVVDMLLSNDPESHMLATRILLNNTEYQSDYLVTNLTSQGDVLAHQNNELHTPLAYSIAKIVKNELQP